MSAAPQPEFALSVVVCTYNNAARLAGALRHLAAQEPAGAGSEVLVIDNNCTDETPQIVEQFQPQIPHLRRIVETRQGQMHARVRGVRESRAPWIAFVDDDNLLDPGWITAALRRIAASPGCGAFAGKVVIDWETPPPEVVARRDYAFASTDLGPAPVRLAGEMRWRLRGAGLVCRRAALEDAGWLEWQGCIGRAGRSTMSGDDTEIVLRIARAGYELWYEPACRLLHCIASRRLNWAYLRSLHYSFALADPLLLGFRGHGSRLTWAGKVASLLLRRTYWVIRHGIQGIVSADARANAILSLDSLRGLICGIGVVTSLDRPQRAAWLGRKNPGVDPTKLRVLHVQNGSLYGGIQRMTTCLAAERAHAPGMVPIFALCYSARLATELRETGVQIEILGPLRTSRPWQWLRVAWNLDRLIRRERIDVVIFHGSWPLALFAPGAALRGRPTVLWMHNDTKIRHKNLIEILAGRAPVDLVIANSAYTAASLPLLFAQPPPHLVLPCPVSLPATADQTPERRAALRAELSTPEDAVVIALAGRPEAWKGHAELIAALAQLRTSTPWACWIIGGAFTAEQIEFLATLQASARDHSLGDRVRFLGQREDVDDLLSAADLFCQPNATPEPFGIAFIEALYASLPIITADHGGGSEIVDATCGRLLPPNDIPALAAALDELISNRSLRETLGRQARPRGLQVSAPARVLPALQSCLTRLVAPRTNGADRSAGSPASDLNLTAHE